MKRAAECLECVVPPVVPVLPLKSTVLFPLQVASVQLASKPNVAVLEAHPSAEEIVAAGVWLDAEGSYARGNLCGVAVACKVLNRIAMPDGTVSVVLQGLRRVRIAKVVASRPYLRARAEPIEETGEETPEVRELIDQVTLLVAQLVDADERYPDELVNVLGLNLGSGSRCADFVADRAQFSYADKRDVLRTEGTAARLTLVARILRRLIARARVTDEVQAKTAALLDRTQRKSLLRAQLAVIRRELDELDPAEAEIAELENRIRKRGLPPIALEEVLRHVQRLREPPIRALEGAAIRDYVEWTLSLPWEEATKDRLDLRRARRVFDERFFAFEEPKKRLIEFLAVRKLGGSARKSLLAVVGPPGTGRTSLARTIAEILGRAFVHLSVRSLRGEAAVRGRRRTDVAGHPSLLLDALRVAGARNPVVLIDDWDYLDEDADDAVSELVGALDPVRNHRFQDHYLGVPFDLSQVLFVLTACVEDSLPEVLSDRMSIIELPGYTEPEKVAIARRYIWPEVVREHGIRERAVSLTAAALRRIVRLYTREAGVYELRGQLERICRRIAVREATGAHRRISIHVRNLEDFLDAPVYVTDPVAREPQIGAVTGLAWTEDGGDLLPIEALLMPGEGRHILTGLLGEVMQESVEAAVSYVRSRSSELGIEPSAFTENDLHVHFPEGAIAKDGPSAGVAVATTIASLLSGRPVRPDLAMTGEIQLRGSILAVGGVREKVLAAYRAGIKHVILPKANERDLSQIPREVRGKVRLHLVEDVADVFKFALTGRRRRAGGAGPSGSRPRSGGTKSSRK